ncbi:putative oligogalacturonide transporter [Klebsiella michiganensis]|nr:putative oligogalacturonide transporter [Klebsiella michiganensis]
MARYTASAPQGLQGRPILLRHQLAYGGGNLLGSGALAISGAWLLYFLYNLLWADADRSLLYFFRRQHYRRN